MLTKSTDDRDRDFTFFQGSEMLRDRWAYISSLKNINEDIERLSKDVGRSSKRQIKRLKKKRRSTAKKAMKQFRIKTKYCTQCRAPTVLCDLCGNNCCNGLSGSYKRAPNPYISYEKLKFYHYTIIKEKSDIANIRANDRTTERVRCTDDCMLAYAINDSLQISDYPIWHRIKFFIGYIVDILDCKVFEGISNIVHKIIKQIRIGK